MSYIPNHANALNKAVLGRQIVSCKLALIKYAKNPVSIYDGFGPLGPVPTRFSTCITILTIKSALKIKDRAGVPNGAF